MSHVEDYKYAKTVSSLRVQKQPYIDGTYIETESLLRTKASKSILKVDKITPSSPLSRNLETTIRILPLALLVIPCGIAILVHPIHDSLLGSQLSLPVSAMIESNYLSTNLLLILNTAYGHTFETLFRLQYENEDSLNVSHFPFHLKAVRFLIGT